jgi:hypothetical protein
VFSGFCCFFKPHHVIWSCLMHLCKCVGQEYRILISCLDVITRLVLL